MWAGCLRKEEYNFYSYGPLKRNQGRRNFVAHGKAPRWSPGSKPGLGGGGEVRRVFVSGSFMKWLMGTASGTVGVPTSQILAPRTDELGGKEYQELPKASSGDERFTVGLGKCKSRGGAFGGVLREA